MINTLINKKMKIIFLKLFAFVLLLNSCAPTIYINRRTQGYEAHINSFGDYNLVGKTFYIASGDKNISSSDVEFREYAKYVKFSMELQGAIETHDYSGESVPPIPLESVPVIPAKVYQYYLD